MIEPKHVKCPCRHCGGPIEFPAHGLGLTVPCPHCGLKTTLFAPDVGTGPGPQDTVSARPTAVGTALRPSEGRAAAGRASGDNAGSRTTELVGGGAHSTRRNRALLWVVLVLSLGIVVGLIAGRMYYVREHGRRPGSGSTSASRTIPPPPVESASNATAAGPSRPEPGKEVATAANPRKSIEDLKVGAVSLERTKGSALVYAVGVLRNESAHQRFGVRLELDLLDAAGRKVGSSKDYRQVIEPRQEWRFHALVVDSRAVSAQVASLREDE